MPPVRTFLITMLITLACTACTRQSSAPAPAPAPAQPQAQAQDEAAAPDAAPSTPLENTLYLSSMQDADQGAPCVLWRADTKEAFDGTCVKSIGQWTFTTGGVLYTFSSVAGGDEGAFMGPESPPLKGWEMRKAFVKVTLFAAPESVLKAR